MIYARILEIHAGGKDSRRAHRETTRVDGPRGIDAHKWRDALRMPMSQSIQCRLGMKAPHGEEAPHLYSRFREGSPVVQPHSEWNVPAAVCVSGDTHAKGRPRGRLYVYSARGSGFKGVVFKYSQRRFEAIS